MLEDVLFELYVKECVEYSRTFQVGKSVFLVTTRTVVSQNVCILILRTCEQVLFHGKLGMIEVRIVKWEDYPGSSR